MFYLFLYLFERNTRTTQNTSKFRFSKRKVKSNSKVFHQQPDISNVQMEECLRAAKRIKDTLAEIRKVEICRLMESVGMENTLECCKRENTRKVIWLFSLWLILSLISLVIFGFIPNKKPCLKKVSLCHMIRLFFRSILNIDDVKGIFMLM
jgi:hypothetical protein